MTALLIRFILHWTERANPLGKPTSKGIYGVWKWIFDKWAWRLEKTRTKTRASEERRVKFRSQKNLENLAWGENSFKWILLSMMFTVMFTHLPTSPKADHSSEASEEWRQLWKLQWKDATNSHLLTHFIKSQIPFVAIIHLNFHCCIEEIRTFSW